MNDLEFESMLDHYSELARKGINRYLPTAWYSNAMSRRLEAGGFQAGAMQFLVLQEIGVLSGLVVYFVLVGPGAIRPVWMFAFVLIGFIVPLMWLNNRVSARRNSFSRDLPEVVDLLDLCIDAGLDFMGALRRIVREFRPCPTIEELGRVLQEVRIGKRRRDALRAMSTRVQTTEGSSFARTLIQADRMGTGMSEALKVLSEDMRMQRYHWAERFAQQAPVKMLIPLLMSLAASLIIVAGPIFMTYVKGDFMRPGTYDRSMGE